ncbi:MAG: DUF2851 family protein [Chthoniobacterales bacterium]|nr:DUF2851 family protein [Chthoniobacterales bacterium]
MTGLRHNYEQAMRRDSDRVAEEPAAEDNELGWQARWFSGACGRQFTATSGEKIVITDFGEWNREAGPDFDKAVVRIGEREQRGAVEVDLDASGWEQHGHATNPDYENVILHVIVTRPSKRHFSRTLAHRDVPQVCLADHAEAKAEWSGFAPARPGRCLAPLRDLPSVRLAELLAVAAQRRFERKGALLAAMIGARGADAALYEAVAVALGYKNNKLPLQLLAQRVPLAAAASRHGESVLFGVAGFLERPEPPASAAHKEVAALWSAWWKQRAARTHSIIPRGAWKISGVRPANHPLRRIGALAAISRRWKTVRAALESGDLEPLEKVLETLEHPFWSYHTTWNSPRRKSPLALVGQDRIREIHANIGLPLALARGEEPAWRDLPAGPPNTPLRVVSARLFGGPLPRSLPRRLFVHQGLLQIYADFCLRDRGECSHCAFPGLVARLPA